MRGIAHLAVPASDPSSVVVYDPENPVHCAVCGQAAEVIASAFSDSFTDRQNLLHVHQAFCTACYTIAKGPSKVKDGKSPGAGDSPPNLLRSPGQGSAGYIISDGEVTQMPGGVNGLHYLLHTADTAEQFGVLVGRWQATGGSPRHSHWLKTPVAYGGSTSFPLYFYYEGQKPTTRNPIEGVLWMSVQVLADFIGSVEEALDNGATIQDLKGQGGVERPPMDCSNQPPQVVQLMVMDYILHTAPPKEKSGSSAKPKGSAGRGGKSSSPTNIDKANPSNIKQQGE